MLFGVFRLVRGTRAVTLLRGVAILLVAVSLMSSLLGLRAFAWLLGNTLPALVVAIPVIFQPELRRVLDRVGRMSTLLGVTTAPESEREQVIVEVVDAVEVLAQRQHGALIVFERETGLQEYIDTGVRMNATVSSQLLLTIFHPNTTLHDGAVIMRGTRMVAAACVLPLSTKQTITTRRRTGLRHRASMGISEVSDALAIVVSEETGIISLVHNGQMYPRLNHTSLVELLETYVGGVASYSPVFRLVNRGTRVLHAISEARAARQQS